jgi:SPP1 gp7 family putative phage head morphogenesis protein
VDVHDLAADWIAAHGQKTLLGTAAKWLKGRAIDLASPIGRVVKGAREDGWSIGSRAADKAERRFDWKRWVPGKGAGQTEQGAALKRLLKDADVTIKSVATHRFDELAKVLADGIERGSSVDDLADAIRPVLSDPHWARTVAITETVRAISASAREQFRKAGVTKVRWVTAGDENVCPTCVANAAAGAVKLDDRFPSGDLGPPGHPLCVCHLSSA